ncbi:hypothetical protein GC175_25945 [bacterium]|nr:hypothetical protein [bacterium]
MKRVIREVVTLIRIERWVVEEDDVTAAVPDAAATPDEPAPLLESAHPGEVPSSNPSATVEVTIEEIVEQPSAPKRRRELFRRVLNVEELGEWGVRHKR